MIGMEWEGYRLIDFASITGGDDPIDDEHPALEVLGAVGITGLGTPPRNTVLTPSAQGGDVPGPSLSRAATIRIDQMRSTDRATVLGFLATMAELAPDDERPLVLHNLLWGTDPVQVWARPETCDPALDALSLGIGDWRLRGTTWTAADPTVYSAAATTVNASTPATTQTLNFTNAGTKASRNGRAWTASITAAGGSVTGPYIALGDQRVTWVGLTLTDGQTLTIDADRHSWVGSTPVDGYRYSGDSPDPDWPIHEPGANAFTVGRASGANLTATLDAYSTW